MSDTESLEFSVPLAENGCNLSIYQIGSLIPEGSFSLNNKKGKTQRKWVANAVIPDHNNFFHAINSTTEWKRQPFVAFGAR
jgi:hypothetical protein